MPWMLRHASKLSVPGSSKARRRDEAGAELGPLNEKISGSPYRKRSGLFWGGEVISFSLGAMPVRLLLPLTGNRGDLSSQYGVSHATATRDCDPGGRGGTIEVRE